MVVPLDATIDGPEPRRQTLRVYTLGTFRIEVDGWKIDNQRWSRRKARQILKCLITRPNRRLTKDEALELFWPDAPPEIAAKTLRSTLSALRDTLARGERKKGIDWIVNDADGVAVRPDVDVWVDADAFEQLIRQARRAPAADDLLEQADRLYVGEYLPDDLYEDWASRRRESLRREWSDLQLALAASRERRTDVDGAASALNRLIRADPCDERAVRELMGLLARNGRRSDALRAYQRLVVALRDELGVEPAAETRELNQQIAAGALDGRSTAASPTPPVTQQIVAVAETPSRLADPEPMPPPERPVQHFTPAYPFPTPTLLIGRQRELLTLERLIDPSRSACRTIVIGAAAGTGKSTLVGALVGRASERNVVCLVGGSFDREHGLPFGAVRDALADYLLAQPAQRLRADLGDIATDLAEIVPEIRYHLGLSSATPSQPIDAGRLFAAVHACLRMLAREHQVLFCLEDLHAADDATLALLHYLARQPRRSPITILGTYRVDEIDARHPLDRLIVALGRDRLVETLTLAPFGQDEAASFVMSLLDGPASDALSASLYTVTEGNPLFLEQLTLALREEGRVDQRDGVWQRVTDDRSTVPPIIRDVIGRRFSRVSDRCREMLALASAFGQTFEHRALVAGLGGVDARVVEDLNEAITAQLVYETASGYRFGHAMVREALYQSLIGPRRRRLHATAAAALETISGTAVDERASELAHHFLLAGDEPEYREKAFRYSIAAGRHAAALSANREALVHFTHASELAERERGGPAPAPGATLPIDARVVAYEGRAWAERQLGMWVACITSCQTILELSTDPVQRARMRSMICRALRSLGDTQQSMVEAETGLAELRTADETTDVASARIQLLYDRAFLHHLVGRSYEVEAIGRQMMEVADRHPHPINRFMSYSTVALACMSQGRDAETIEFYRQSISAAEQANDLIGQAVFHENLGKQHHQAGRFDEATTELQHGVRFYETAAAGPRSVNALHWLARVKLSQGDVAAAEQQATSALSRAVGGQDRWAAECHDVLGAIYTVRSSWPAAEASYERALSIRERVGHADGIVESLVGLAVVAERRGDWPRAERLARRALDVALSMDPCPDQVRPMRVLGRVFGRRGDAARADEYLTRALALVQPMAPSLELVPTLLACAEERLRQNEAGAFELLETALASSAAAESAIELEIFLAGLLSQRGQVDEAAVRVAAATRRARQAGAPRLIGLAQLAAARVKRARGEDLSAQAEFEAAMRSLGEADTPYELALATRDYGCSLIRRPGRAERARALLTTARMHFEMLGAVPDMQVCLRGLADVSRV